MSCRISPATPLLLQGDPGRLRQVLVNLLGNAIKFTEQGEVAVSVEAVGEGHAAKLRFTLSDTGIGIDEPNLRTIFAPFVQADGSTTRKFGGTGLGLAICKQLVAMMKGEIGVESTLGKGSTFWFTVACKRQAAVNAETPAMDEAWTRQQILITDSSVNNRWIVSGLLRGWGFRCQEAGEWQHAVALLNQAACAGQPFGVALIDQHLWRPEPPGSPGELPALQATVAILMSRVGEEWNEERLAESGFVAQVSKPIWSASLRDCLRRAFDGEHGVAGIETVSAARREAAAGKRRARVLVVEDNETNQEVAIALLHKLGYNTELARNGALALRLLQSRHIDIVLMDCAMPEMDGLEATRRIRDGHAGAGNRQVPIVALTADAMAVDRDRCFRAGMNDYISKPVSSQQLTNILAKWTAAVEREFPPAAESLPASPSAAIFNEPDLLARLMGDRTLARKLIGSFLRDVPAKLSHLKQFIHDADGDSIRREAHALKGAAANLSASSLKALAVEMQQAGAAGDLGRCEELASHMESEFQQFQSTLAQLEWAQAGN